MNIREKKNKKSGDWKTKYRLKFKLTTNKQMQLGQLQKERSRSKVEYQQNKETSDTRHDSSIPCAQNHTQCAQCHVLIPLCHIMKFICQQ